LRSPLGETLITWFAPTTAGAVYQAGSVLGAGGGGGVGGGVGVGVGAGVGVVGGELGVAGDSAESGVGVLPVDGVGDDATEVLGTDVAAGVTGKDVCAPDPHATSDDERARFTSSTTSVERRRLSTKFPSLSGAKRPPPEARDGPWR
jgi:hypothetical protein